MKDLLLKKPIFIIGSGRSGTTLLQRMLRSHSNISSPTGESHFFIPLYKYPDKYGDLSQAENVKKVLEEMRRISREFCEEDLHGLKFDTTALANEFVDKGVNSTLDIISLLLTKNALGENKNRWLEKTPYYILHISTLLKMFPDAQFVHIIRDGRDCALSMLERKYDLKIFNIYQAAKIWSRYVDMGQEAKEYLSSDVYFEFRYEDLISDPETKVKEICTFLGEKYEDNVVDFIKSQDPKNKTPMLKKGIQKNNFDKWRTKMTIWQIRVFESVAGDTLKRNNYSVSTKCKPIFLPIRIFYRLHEKYIRWYDRNFRK